LRIFVDNCLSYVLASTLNGYVTHLGHTAVHIRNMRCGPHASDVEWMVITGDLRISKNRPERLAFAKANLKGIALAPGYQSLRVHQQASIILWRWPDIENAVAQFQPPFLFELPVGKNTGLRALRL